VICPKDRHLDAAGPVEETELGCPCYGHCWHADGREEYGTWFTIE
jgi:hypothetical protein